MVEPLTFELPRAATLDPATVRALWDMRMRIMGLKPTVPPEVDRAAFTARVLGGSRIAIGRDRDGIPRGMYLGHRDPYTTRGGRRVNLMTPEYGFVEAPWRGTPFSARAFLAVTLTDLAADPLHPPLIVGSIYPATYLQFGRGGRPLCILDDPPDWMADCLEYVGPRDYGDRYDPATGVVELPTLPPPLPPANRRPPGTDAALAHYEARNPRWREGFALLCAVHMDYGAWRGASRILLRRFGRIARRWRPGRRQR